MENPTHTFREMKLELLPIQKSRIKSKIVMSWSSRKKKSVFFVTFVLPKGNFLNPCVLSQCILPEWYLESTLEPQTKGGSQ